MSASFSKLHSLADTVMENVPAPQTLKKACHQMTANFGGACKSKKNRNKRPCPLRYCAKCLLNRYGKQEKVAQMKDRWSCPKCRGICNCSCCRKKRGEMPTGMLINVAKAIGCASVHHLLLLQKGSEAVAAVHVDGSLKCVPKSANNFRYEGADLIALLPPALRKKRTKLNYRPNPKYIVKRSPPNKKYIVKSPPLPRSDDNVIPNGSQATSSAGVQAGESLIMVAPRFIRLWGVDIFL